LASPKRAGWDDLYLRILLRSLWLALQTTVIVILMAYPLAYFIARAPAKRRNLLLFLVLIPLWTNFIIRIYAWVMILRTQGVLNSALGWIAGLLTCPLRRSISTPRRGRAGGHGLRIPALYDPADLHLAGKDRAKSLYEAAADLYANAFRTFWRVTLPLSMPGVVAGTILTFVPVIGTFVVSDILGGRQVILVGNLVQRQFLDARNPPFGSARRSFCC
jgi:spermidine/putrescine transport system permease protein